MAFDIETYVRHSAALKTDDIDFDVFRTHPLDTDSLRCLRYMHDVEFHTTCYLRDLLVTRAHADPEITTFLTFWAYEEHFHGDAIAKILQVHDEVAGRERVRQSRIGLRPRDAFNPLISMLSSALIKDLIAIHMTWGAINEWTTQAGYARLIAKAEHPVLTELLKRIMKQEGRHIDFYSTRATQELSGNQKVQKLTRLILRKKWAPVGSGVMPKSEVRFMITHLFGDDDGAAMAARLDRRIDRLPGLDHLSLISGALDKWSDRSPQSISTSGNMREVLRVNA